MKFIAGNNKRDLIIETDTLIMGHVEGNISVLSGAKLHLEATLKGNLYLSKHSSLSISNKMIGNIYDRGASIEFVNGKVEGDIIKC